MGSVRNVCMCVYRSNICFPGGSDGEEHTCNTGDSGLIPRSGRSPRRGNGYPFQYSCLENFVDRGAWQATGVHGGRKELDTTERLTLSLLHLFSHC